MGPTFFVYCWPTVDLCWIFLGCLSRVELGAFLWLGIIGLFSVKFGEESSVRTVVWAIDIQN